MMTTIFLEDTNGPPMLIFYGLIILVMYMFFFRPQMKRQKEEKKFQQGIKKGSRIVTTSGIHAKILDVSDTFVIIESENSRLKIEKSAISKSLSDQINK